MLHVFPYSITTPTRFGWLVVRMVSSNSSDGSKPGHQSISKYNRRLVERAAEAISDSDALLITAGAGMGVDSGLPDFRGPQGLWRAYPALKERGLTLPEVSTPHWFEKDPTFAWGFFGHRYKLYSKTQANVGFQILKNWADKMTKGYFVFTSNVDGHFQKAGFSEDNIVECHGSINYLQCVDSDKFPQIWPVPPNFRIEMDDETLTAKKPLPLGPDGEDICLARPNVMMFGDYGFIDDRTDEQYLRYHEFKKQMRYAKLVVMEIGAGLALPTLRIQSEIILERSIVKKGILVRINPREPEVPDPDENISLELSGLTALTEIDAVLRNKNWL